MSNSPNTFTGDVLDKKSFPQSSAYGENFRTSSDPSSSRVIVQSLHSAASEPVFGSYKSSMVTFRPRSKSVPTFVEQQVALFLRTISDNINNSYGNISQNATDRNRRASYPGNVRLQETLSPLLRTLPMGIPSSTNFQSESAAVGKTRPQQTGIGGHHPSSSMGCVPEEGSDSGDEV